MLPRCRAQPSRRSFRRECERPLGRKWVIYSAPSELGQAAFRRRRGPTKSPRGNDEGPACGEPFIVPVGLVYLCSTNSETGVTTASLRRILRDSADVRTPGETTATRRKWTRLSDEARTAVIERYEAGETTTSNAPNSTPACTTGAPSTASAPQPTHQPKKREPPAFLRKTLFRTYTRLLSPKV